MDEFDIEQFIENSKKRREKLAKYRQEQARKKQKYNRIKGVIAGGTALVIMGIGIVKYFPSMFNIYEAKQDNNDYSDSNKVTQSTTAKVSATESQTASTSEVKYRSKKTYKITKKSIEKKEEVKLKIDKRVAQFLDGYVGQLVKYYSDCYGVDASIIAAICMTESSLEHESCCPGGIYYNGYGVGICQIESPDGTDTVTAYNYETGEYDSIVITMDNACDIEMNIKIACMQFQNSLEECEGNILLAIQAHNFGKDMVNLILRTNYDNPEKIKRDYTNISWIECMKDAHYNPQKYVSDWEGTYGVPDYLMRVTSNCPTKQVNYIYKNKRIKMKLDTLQIISTEDIKNNKSVKR